MEFGWFEMKETIAETVNLVYSTAQLHVDRAWIIRVHVQSPLDISKLWGLFFTSSNYPKCKLICTPGNLNLKKSP